ncbi:MAG: alanine racemase [Candidatus Caldatribacterium sp.]|uniref:alanine racemase n=1 Tax=Candidatus Caldatribacterium sp. TaxID=2282143 RepID=UPI00299433E9|nr:alanine racemase [Candidatus Caldatribacterium sp.]MCX7731390.1 alanine racemase [Candidatus Caldatribacterium sp.]MDW8080900.1 alanine racemase [Candidatus Calescibacterium sp.]
MEHGDLHCWMEISLENLAHNVAVLRGLARPHGDIMGVVKANVYGHGVGVASCLAAFGLRKFGVASLEEALELQKASVVGDIYILGGFFPHEAEVIVKEGFVPIVSSREELESLRREGTKQRKTVRFHLKIDTGMGRMGCLLRDFNDAFFSALSTPPLVLGGVMTHFASAESDPEYTEWQFRKFCSFLKRWNLLGSSLECHCANSAAFLFFPHMRLALNRIGIALFGASPTGDVQVTRSLDLRPVTSIRARVKLVKTLPPGFRVGYGGTFVTSRWTKVAVVALGYAQGLFRSFSNNLEVLVRGKRAPLIGTVSMDQVMVDVSHIEGVTQGDVVTFIGRDEGEEIRVEELARRIGTIPHEVFCSFGKLKHRFFV